jgi:hypothetical protein
MVITIEEAGDVLVYAPQFVQIQEIHKFIHEKSDWIQQRVRKAKDFTSRLKEKRFDHGQEFLFQGKKYALNVRENHFLKRSKINFDGIRWTVEVSSESSNGRRQQEIKRLLILWYQTQAKEIFGSRLFNYARIMQVEALDITVRSQKRIWGCCDHRKKRVSLNWHLVMSPLAVIDYVVVHELCHLFVPNHSRKFWNRVKQFMPDYRKREQWLKDHALDMKLPEIMT